MKNSFYGWYLKCQSETQTLAVIPAFHQGDKGRSCSIQVITGEASWRLSYPDSEFYHTGSSMLIGKNYFYKRGMKLAIQRPDLCIEGELVFGELTPPGYDVMGPLAYVPFLECRHMVWSMNHPVWGTIRINGKEYCFHRARGRMTRRIQESVEGRAFYRFRKGEKILFAFETNRASFEYEYA